MNLIIFYAFENYVTNHCVLAYNLKFTHSLIYDNNNNNNNNDNDNTNNTIMMVMMM